MHTSALASIGAFQSVWMFLCSDDSGNTKYATEAAPALRGGGGGGGQGKRTEEQSEQSKFIARGSTLHPPPTFPPPRAKAFSSFV